MTVWEAIALHTTPEIPRYKQPEVRLRDKPETAFGTMNTDILEATAPEYVRPNFCDYIQNSRFES
jgi:hypothetical protein